MNSGIAVLFFDVLSTELLDLIDLSVPRQSIRSTTRVPRKSCTSLGQRVEHSFSHWILILTIKNV